MAKFPSSTPTIVPPAPPSEKLRVPAMWPAEKSHGCRERGGEGRGGRVRGREGRGGEGRVRGREGRGGGG